MTTGAIGGCPNAGAARGRQLDCAVSPDGKMKAFYRDRNLWVANFDGTGERAVTTDGSVAGRIKNGTGSWHNCQTDLDKIIAELDAILDRF